ncbi:thioredoxin-like protein [Aspergillus cavernicola]|uniref:Thioredoxin-like protein n=1 Tax=Aspergillus cavernicola TaxID=176166 RepID=A0ABR4IW41_9EURO
MFSQRRIRLLVATALVVFILYLHYSGDNRSVQNQEFYKSTVAAMDAEKGTGAGDTKAGNHDPPVAKEQLGSKPGEEYSYVVGDDKEQPAIPKAPPPPPQVQQVQVSDDRDVEEIPIAGRTSMTMSKDKDQSEVEAESLKEKEKEKEKEEHEKEEERKRQKQLEEDLKDTKAELNGILKRSPIIIFSKSYCPYSKKAKTILFEKYSIVPAPFVVELDQHPLGQRLQALLGENTGRRTVPNVLVNGRSIGGGDDMAALDEHDELASRLRSLGGKWLQEVKRKEPESNDG